MKTPIVLFSSFLFLFIFTSCVTNPETNDWVKVIDEYERLKITATNIPQSDAEKVSGIYRVTRSGYLKLPYLNPMRAKGIDQFEVAQQITNAYQASGRYYGIQVTVQVVNNRSLY